MTYLKAAQTLFYAGLGLLIMAVIILPVEYLAFIITGRSQNIAGRFTNKYQAFCGAKR